jgi:NAD(P)-dependent dehydrogenase (short-subunit alcohol dehydrogenase family)
MATVLVTGCSSGFGLSSAITLATRGWEVFATMRNPEKRERLDKAAAGAGVTTNRLHVLPLDVTDQASIDGAAGEVLGATNGSLDAVVHNAGVSAGGAFEDVPDDEVRRIMETNFFGVLALTRAVLPAMRARRRGRVVVVSSNSAFSGTPGLSAYNASKWAIEGWAESVAYEVEPFGIQMVLVEPGSYRTDIFDSSPRLIPDDSAYGEMARIIEPMIERRVIARARDPQEVADTIVRVLETPRPRLRYPVGPDAKVGLAVRGVVPFRAQKAVVTRVLGMQRWRP